MRRLAIALLASAAAATPAAAGIVCHDPEATVEIAVALERGKVGHVSATTPYVTLSTEAEETLAFERVADDRIEIMLESPDVGPVTLFLDIVRLVSDDPDEGTSHSISAGVAHVASVGPVTLVCTGWQSADHEGL